MRSSRGPSVVLVALALGLLAACSSGDDGEVATAPSTAAAATSTTTTGVTTDATCVDQNFTPNTDDIAGDIVADGLPCADAEAFVRRVGPLVGATGGPADISVAGFVCLRTRQDDGLYGIPSADYECTSGDKTVTFRRT